MFWGNVGSIFSVFSAIGAQLKTQSFAAVITIVWTLVGTYIALKVASVAGLRVHADDEEAGLDLTQHTERGYDI